MMSKNHAKTGFTLIELSIVLVVIGLVIGGILVGQDIIKAAEVRQAVSYIQNVETAVVTFKTKYNCLPGDCSNAASLFSNCAANESANGWPNLCNGDGSGGIGDGVDGVANGRFGEADFRLWEHLSLAQLIQGKYTGLWAGGMTPGGNTPVADWMRNNIGPDTTYGNAIGVEILYRDPCLLSLDNGCVLNVGEPYYSGVLNNRGSGHRLKFGKLQAWMASNPYEGFRGQFVRSIDMKMDDGKPLSGKVKVPSWAGAPNYCTDGTMNKGQDYLISAAIPDCAMIVEMSF